MRGPNEKATERARMLRRDATETERKLWSFLRGNQLSGAKFVRQEPIGPYFADFACRKSKLVIEIDGPTHASPDAQAHDTRRTIYLNQLGYRVLRFSNEQIYGDLGPVLDEILRNL